MKTDERQTLGQRLVEAGIVTAAVVARANRDEDQAEAIGVRLVLLGALKDEDLADFFANETGVSRATESELAGCVDVFDVLPFEVIYDSAVLPIRYSDDDRLVVGVVDPHQTSNLEEVQFFAGLELEIRILALGEFATAFERNFNVPWRIPAEELRSLRRGLGESQDRLDDDLRRLFASVSNSAAYPAIVEEVTAASEVVDVLELTTPHPRGPASVTPRISVEALQDDEVRADFIELKPARAIESGSGELEVVDDDAAAAVDIPIVEVLPLTVVETIDDESFEEVVDLVRAASQGPVAVPRSVSGSRVSITTSLAGEPIAVRSTGSRHPVETRVNETIRGLEPALPHSRVDLSGKTPPEPESDDSAFPSRMLPLEPEEEDFASRAEQRTPATSVSAVLASEISQPGMRPPDASVSGLGLRARSHSRTTGAQIIVQSPRGMTSGAVGLTRQNRPTPRPVPTVGEYLGSELTGRFGTMREIVGHLGEPAAATTAAIGLALQGLEEVEARDEVAQELVETLSLVYPTVLVLRLKLPRLVVWGGGLSTGGDGPSGFSFEVQEKSVWHRVTSEGSHFAGTLPVDGPLRRHLPRAIGSATLVIPLRMGGRVVGVLVLDAGATGRLEPPGSDIERLCEGFEVALRRVIVNRKKSVRSV